MPIGTDSLAIALALKAAAARSTEAPVSPASAVGGTWIRASAPLVATR